MTKLISRLWGILEGSITLKYDAESKVMQAIKNESNITSSK